MRAKFLAMIALVFIILMGSAACSSAPQEAYTPEKAKKHGDVVAYGDHESDQVSHLTKLLQFVNNVKNGKEDTVQISIFNKANKATINQIKYDGKNLKLLIKPLGKEKDIRKVCKSITAEESGFFTLKGCNGANDSVTILGASAYAYKKAMLELENE